MDLVEREGNAEVRDLVLLSDGGGRGVQIGAGAAQIGHHALRGQRLHPTHRLGRVGLVVEQDQLERHLLAGDHDAAGGVDLLDGDFVARPYLRAEAAVTACERNDRSHLHGLRDRRRRPGDERDQRGQAQHLQ